MGEDRSQEALFPELDADALESAMSVLPSLCMNCEEEGETRLLLTKIPFFKDVIVSSFSCDACGFSNRTILPASAIEDRGVRIELQVRSAADLQRQVVVQEGAEIRLPALDSVFPFSQGRLTTIEGVLSGFQENIQATAAQAQTENPDLFVKLVQFAGRLGALLTADEPFSLVVDDPRGASFVENPLAPEADPQLRTEQYERTPDQDARLGIAAAAQEEEEEKEKAEAEEAPFDPKAEVLTFPVNCSKCGAPCLSKMKMVDIPHFKEVVIMAVDCDACGFRDSEVKGGGGVAPKGRRLTLHVTCAADLSRDVLKSDTAALRIPELEMEAGHGTLGGKFTTVEGLLTAVRDQLRDTNPFLFGDSAPGPELAEGSAKLRNFVARLDKILAAEEVDLHIVIDDPAGNSHIQNLYAPDPDPELLVEDYERTAEDEEVLGIDMMKTENYRQD